MWNLVRSLKGGSRDTTNDIDIQSIEQCVREKFGSAKSTPYIDDCHREVVVKRDAICNTQYSTYLSEDRAIRYIKALKSGCAHGMDGVLAEHLKHGINCNRFIHQLSVMLSVSLQFGVVPTSFRQGVLVPLLKKPTADPSVAKNYRPIVVSSVLSKLMEMYILEECECHDFEDCQFGFVKGR